MKTLKLFITSIFIIICHIVNASSLLVSSDIGFNANDSTSFLQQAFNSNVDTLIIDNVGQPWKTAPLYINQSDLTIIIEPNVEIVALDNVYDLYDSVFRIWDVQNITIIGYQATIRMNKQEYIIANDSEYRHGFNIGSATNIRIEGLTIKDTGGDGVLLSKSFYANSPKNYCENVTIKNCSMDNNYRQGISVGSAKNCTIENCILSNTKGTLPEAGIDIEPDNPQERIENLQIKNCTFLNNNGNGIQLTTFYLNDISTDITVTIEDCYFSGNHDPSNSYAYAEMTFYDNEGNGADGLVTVRNCYVENSDWSGIYIKKTVDSYDLNFENCVFKNVSQNPINFNNPIFFEVTNYTTAVPRFGGVNFIDCGIYAAADIPFLSVFENAATSDGLGNVNGNFFIVSPNDNGFEIGNNPQNVNINYQHFTQAPASEVSLTANQTEYTENGMIPITYQLSRTATTAIPLAVNLELTGTALYGVDYDLHQNFAMFASGANQTDTSFHIVDDTLDETSETATLTIASNDCYMISPENSETVTILDNEILSIVDIPSETFQLYPNPATSEVFITLIPKDLDEIQISIHDITGKRIQQTTETIFSNQHNTLSINISDLASGLYIISGDQNGERLFQEKLVVRRF